MTNLELFYDHKLLIDVIGASKEDLDELQNKLNRKYVDGQNLSDVTNSRIKYLHCIYINETNAIQYSKTDCDMPTVSWEDIVGKIPSIDDKELEEIYG